MSTYRALKHLIGETSLERKCHILFGLFILVLIIPSFWFYSWQTEHLAYDQLKTSSRLLVPSLIAEQHHAATDEKKAAAVEKAMAEVRSYWDDKVWPNDSAAPRKVERGYKRTFIKPDDPEKRPQDSAGYERLREFRDDPSTYEFNQQMLSEGKNFYYAAIRATKSCTDCHYHEKNAHD